MATRKDQLDAFNFARRRMVANLVVPTATGSDEGAPRPVKTFATSIILSAIAVAAVAVLGVFKPSAPSGWQAGLAVDSNTGAAYITQNNELHAVYNITSARLILGKNFQKFDVPDSTLNGSGTTIGAPVGILGAPEDVPSAANMNLTQWSFCQNEKETDANQAGGATFLEIGYWPAPNTTQNMSVGGAQGSGPNSNDALIVHDSQGDVYLVDGTYKYELANAQSSELSVLLTAVNQDRNFEGPGTGFYVSDAWLSAFQLGSRITYPTLQNLGAPVNLANQPAETSSGTVVGAYGSSDESNGGVVQTADGLVQLNALAYSLYKHNPALASDHIPTIPASALSSSAITLANNGKAAPNPANVFETGSYGVNWPQIPPTLAGFDTTDVTTQNICVGFAGQYSGSGNAKMPVLTTWTSAHLPFGSPTSQFGLTQTGSNLEANTVVVKPGYGLIAQAGSGSQFLIEDSGYRYELLTETQPNSSGGTGSGSGSTTAISAREQLGYKDTAVEPVPSGWMNLIQGGAQLNPLTAGQTPGTGN